MQLTQELDLSSESACLCSSFSQPGYSSNVDLLCVYFGTCFVSICHRVNKSWDLQRKYTEAEN